MANLIKQRSENEVCKVKVSMYRRWRTSPNSCFMLWCDVIVDGTASGNIKFPHIFSSYVVADEEEFVRIYGAQETC
jgi:hypothetical protein